MKKIFLGLLLSLSLFASAQTKRFVAMRTSTGQFSVATDDANIATIGDSVYYFNGTDNSTVYNTMYSSGNGGRTIVSLGTAPWSIRNASAVFKKNNKIILCGGRNMSTDLLDAWEFSGGYTYTQLTATMTGFGAARHHFAFGQDVDTFFVLGGDGATDVIRSTDGITWTSHSTLPANLQNMTGMTMTKFKNTWYIHGGKVGAAYPGYLYRSDDNLRTFTLVATNVFYAEKWATMTATVDAVFKFKGENDTRGGNQRGWYYTLTPDDVNSWVQLPYHGSASHAVPACVSTDGTKVYTHSGNMRNDTWEIRRRN